ncbi:MAG TPA: NAD-dependent epimerase/dehydratase family protein [Acidimicrobiales bacterium]|nr:NAD-dependent epimerase/dehydratase family protein [Acidimicrobiales bacterium]
MAGDRHETGQLHVVVGAGPIGRGVAGLLLEAGQRVRVVTRSGSGPEGAERVAADAAEDSTLRRLSEGATALYNCANPPYHRWPAEWPPMARSLLGAAEANGAVLVTVANLYGYGPAPASLGVDEYDEAHPMTEATPLAATGVKGTIRAGMWRDALAAHEAGRIRATEVRASDYIGPGAGSVVGDRFVPRVLKGKGVTALGRPDQPHTWSYIGDVCRMVVTAGQEPRAWGRAWHTPSNEPRTQKQVAEDFARVAGVRRGRVTTVPSFVLHAAGVVSPLMRELRETEYQFRRAFVMNSSAATETFGLEATPWEQVLDTTLGYYGRSTKHTGGHERSVLA